MVLVQIDDDASMEEVKGAYRYLAKQCHPDYLGDEGHDLCILLNEVGPRDWQCRVRQKVKLRYRGLSNLAFITLGACL